MYLVECCKSMSHIYIKTTALFRFGGKEQKMFLISVCGNDIPLKNPFDTEIQSTAKIKERLF